MNERPYRLLSLTGLVTTFMVSLNLHAYSQDTLYAKNTNHYWAHSGIGGSSSGLSIGIGFTYQVGIGLVSFRFARGGESEILGPSPQEYEWDGGLLIGIGTTSSHVHASASAGVGVVQGVRRGKFIRNISYVTKEYDKETYTTFGFPFECQFFWIMTSTVGIGINGFANLNREKSFVGGLLSAQFGVLQ